MVPPQIAPWAETDTSVLSDPISYTFNLSKEGLLVKKISPEPLPVAVTVTEGEEKPKIVVIGDADFITNDALTRSRAREYFYGMLSSSLDWLAERPVLGIAPKQTNTYTLGPNVDRNRMVLLPGALMGLGIVGLGVGVWVVRRR
jgi:hypothetical protein